MNFHNSTCLIYNVGKVASRICRLPPCSVVTGNARPLTPILDGKTAFPQGLPLTFESPLTLRPSAAVVCSRSQLPPNGRAHQKFRHWYLHKTLKITTEDILELGPRNAHAASVTKQWAKRRREILQRQGESADLFGTGGSIRGGKARRSAPYAGNDVDGNGLMGSMEDGVVGDPGVGAFATARGGGWMGAANGR